MVVPGTVRPSSPSGGIAVAAVEHSAPSTTLSTEALYRRHAERVWRYCLHFLRRPADAEDALQQTFLQAHRALARGVEPESEAAWLLAIARNVCLTRADTQRRRGRAELAEDPRLLDLVGAADAVAEGISDDVRAAFARLPERQRQALFLREWQECSYSEIAAALGTSESAVETLLFRARRTLARELGRPRNVGDVAGLLGWLRYGLAPAATKVVLGAVVVAVGIAGTDAATQAQHARGATVRERAAHAARPLVAAPRVAVPTHRAVRPRPARRRVLHARVRGGVAEAVPASPSSPARAAPPTAPKPVEPQQPAAPVTRASQPAPATPQPATTTATTTTATGTVSDATNAVASTVDTVAQTAATAVPAAAPVVTTAAQTASGAAQTVESTAQTVTTAVSNVLPGR